MATWSETVRPRQTKFGRRNGENSHVPRQIAGSGGGNRTKAWSASSPNLMPRRPRGLQFPS